MPMKFTIINKIVKNIGTDVALHSTSLFDFLRGCVSRVLLERPKNEDGRKRSVSMITPTEILTKRTCELFQDWS